MKIILSPAKKMNVDTDTLEYDGLPVFLDKTQELMAWLQSKTAAELKKLWGCNDAILKQNVERLQNMDITQKLTPAILSYEGIAYQYMAPAVFESKQLDYVQQHLRILSGFYGVLKPMDGVTPYRLEMQAKVKLEAYKDLYEFWGKKLYQEVRDEDGVIINLASKEYSKCVEKYITKSDTFITCTFAERVNGKLLQKGTYAKMARGEMVRFLAEQGIERPEEMKYFDRLGYAFQSELSSETEYVFEKNER